MKYYNMDFICICNWEVRFTTTFKINELTLITDPRGTSVQEGASNLLEAQIDKSLNSSSLLLWKQRFQINII
jgi:hypothetical protein